MGEGTTGHGAAPAGAGEGADRGGGAEMTRITGAGPWSMEGVAVEVRHPGLQARDPDAGCPCVESHRLPGESLLDLVDEGQAVHLPPGRQPHQPSDLGRVAERLRKRRPGAPGPSTWPQQGSPHGVTMVSGDDGPQADCSLLGDSAPVGRPAGTSTGRLNWTRFLPVGHASGDNETRLGPAESCLPPARHHPRLPRGSSPNRRAAPGRRDARAGGRRPSASVSPSMPGASR